MEIFDRLESNVRAYCRDFPVLFDEARGYRLHSQDGRAFIDFFAGAGALNYGHNNPKMKRALIEYLERDGVTHSLDMATVAKAALLEKLHRTVLAPRGMPHKVMFPGPTGTNTVESALKLARKVTGRETVIGFTNGFHGMTLGSLAVTGNAFKRNGAGVPLSHTVSMPFDGYLGEDTNTLEYIERLLDDDGSGVDLPAAMIVETVQGEGGLRAASFEWLRGLADLCRRRDILLIVDDVQAGCGRTGPFFSFEPAGIQPDIICLSKSISGYGLPLALTLVKPEIDKFAAGEHNGTFRGHNPAFITAAVALDYWQDDSLSKAVEAHGERVHEVLLGLADRFEELDAEVRGRGLMRGLVVGLPGAAKQICAEAFRRGLVMETSGPDSEVAKVMPPLTIDEQGLSEGLAILSQAAEAVARQRRPAKQVA